MINGKITGNMITGSRSSLACVFSVSAESSVPTARKPAVPSNMTRASQNMFGNV